MNLRNAGVADLVALGALERTVFGVDSYPPFWFRQALDLWPAHLFVAAAQGDALGGYALGAVAARAREAWLLSLAVHPDHRGRGLAAGLAAVVVESFAVRGFERIALTVSPRNTAAVRLDEKLGFAIEAEEANYFGGGERRWRMVRALL